jgi:hypothetical protein
MITAAATNDTVTNGTVTKIAAAAITITPCQNKCQHEHKCDNYW